MFCEIPVFGRCCFCLPLRKGILAFGYLNILFASFMVGVYSYSIHHEYHSLVVFHGVAGDSIDNWLCVLIYLCDVIFTAVLLYGAHRQIMKYLRVYYYYTLCTLAAVILLEIVVGAQRPIYYELELMPLFLAGLGIHVYLIFLVRSLLKKLEMSGHTYENQLHQIVNGEIVKSPSPPNTVYPSTVVPVESA